MWFAKLINVEKDDVEFRDWSYLPPLYQWEPVANPQYRHPVVSSSLYKGCANRCDTFFRQEGEVAQSLFSKPCSSRNRARAFTMLKTPTA